MVSLFCFSHSFVCGFFVVLFASGESTIDAVCTERAIGAHLHGSFVVAVCMAFQQACDCFFLSHPFGSRRSDAVVFCHITFTLFFGRGACNVCALRFVLSLSFGSKRSEAITFCHVVTPSFVHVRSMRRVCFSRSMSSVSARVVSQSGSIFDFGIVPTS